jgi:hypothetical protein
MINMKKTMICKIMTWKAMKARKMIAWMETKTQMLWSSSRDIT